MRRGGRRLPVLAEIAGSAADRTRVFSLRRDDFARLAGVQERLAGYGTVLVAGEQDAARTVAIALAGVAAAGARRTALVDCDLARPGLAGALGLAAAPGVHEYLRWEATAPQLLQPLALAGPASAAARDPLVFIAAGREAADPTTLLGLQSFRHMAAKLRHAYDLVVLSAPTPEVDGGAQEALATEADAVLAGLPPRQAKGRPARAAAAALRGLPAEALGAVIVGEG
jgi:Mrp family chromosome partitioning ATPase